MGCGNLKFSVISMCCSGSQRYRVVLRLAGTAVRIQLPRLRIRKGSVHSAEDSKERKAQARAARHRGLSVDNPLTGKGTAAAISFRGNRRSASALSGQPEASAMRAGKERSALFRSEERKRSLKPAQLCSPEKARQAASVSSDSLSRMIFPASATRRPA